MKNITLIVLIIFVAFIASVFSVETSDDTEDAINANSKKVEYKIPVDMPKVLPKSIVKKKEILEKKQPKKTTNTKKHLPTNVKKTKKKVVKPVKKEVAQVVKHVVKHLKSPQIDLMELEHTLISLKNNSEFTIANIAKHSSKDDCYLLINGNVYDVSDYMPYHPAGSRIIVKYCGKETTGIFAKIHSNRAWDLLKKYKIGVISKQKQSTGSIVPRILEALNIALKKANPTAVIVNVVPKKGGYIGKVIFDGAFYEIHMNKNGKIFKEEIDSDETNWILWDSDLDDK